MLTPELSCTHTRVSETTPSVRTQVRSAGSCVAEHKIGGYFKGSRCRFLAKDHDRAGGGEVTVTSSEVYYDPYDWEIDTDPYPVWKRLRDEAPLY
jgi:hypothetical protein